MKGRQWLSSGPGNALFLKGIRCGAKQGSISKNWIKVYEDNCPVAPVLPLEHSASCDFHCKLVLIRNSLKHWLTTEKSQLCIQMTARNSILQNFITDNEGINRQLTTIETKKNRLLTKDFSILNASLFLIKCVEPLLFISQLHLTLAYTRY